VVVREDDPVSSCADGLAEDVARVHRALAQGALRDAARLDEAAPDVDEDDPELLAIGVRDVAEELGDPARIEDALAAVRRRPARAAAELEGGGDGGRTGLADALLLHQLLGRRPRELRERRGVEKPLGGVAGVIGAGRGAEDDGEELGVGERARPRVEESIVGRWNSVGCSACHWWDLPGWSGTAPPS
jgi:hypothetical protein